MKIRIKCLAVLILCLSILSGIDAAIDMVVKTGGTWSVSVGLSDLTGGPGSDFTPDHETVTDYTQINIRGVKSLYYEIDVKRVDTNWNSNIHFYVRRSATTKGQAWGEAPLRR